MFELGTWYYVVSHRCIHIWLRRERETESWMKHWFPFCFACPFFSTCMLVCAMAHSRWDNQSIFLYRNVIKRKLNQWRRLLIHLESHALWFPRFCKHFSRFQISSCTFIYCYQPILLHCIISTGLNSPNTGCPFQDHAPSSKSFDNVSLSAAIHFLHRSQR